MILAVTGHRPHKLGGYSDEAFKKLYTLASDYLAVLQPTLVITGMALGWDQAIAQAAIDLGIPFHAYVPCDSQDRKWPFEAGEKYRKLLSKAAKVVVTCPGPYAVWKMQVRNEKMVDEADTILACWDGSNGGTYNCIEYAKKKAKPVVNCYKEHLNEMQNTPKV